nr:MAG TPA: hypothetical protein [Caudoviricetes sp.]
MIHVLAKLSPFLSRLKNLERFFLKSLCVRQ